MNWKRMCDVLLSATVAGFLYTFCVPVANAQNPQCPTRPAGDNTNACASTAFVQNAVSSHTPPVTIGEFVIGTGTLHDKMTLWGQQIIYLPNLASDPGVFSSLFIGNGGGSLVHTSGLDARYITCVGMTTCLAITTGKYITGLGFEVFEFCTTCDYSTAVGEASQIYNLDSVGATSLGWKAALGCFGTPCGTGTPAGISIGNYIVAIGYSSNINANGGDNNVFVGKNSGFGDVTSGVTSDDQVGIGRDTLYEIGGGLGFNTCVGPNTCRGIVTGAKNTILGGSQTGLSSSLSNEIRISDGDGALGFRSDSSRNTYLGDGTTAKNVYLYYATASNNAGLTTNSSGDVTLFTGTAGTATRQQWYADGGVTTGTPTGASKGAGTLNAAQFYVNGSQIALGGNFTMSGAFTFTGTLTGNTSVTFPTSGTLATTTTPAASIIVGTTTVTSGTSTRVLYDNAGVLGEYTLTGSGTVVAMQTAPTFVTSITAPLVIGGTGTTGTQLTLKTTTGVGTTDALAIVGGNNGATTFGTFTATKLDIPQTTASTSTTTGALTIAGGIGVAGAGFFGASSEINKTTAGAVTYMTVRADGSATAATGAGFRLITDGGTFSFITYATGSATNTNITTPSGKLVYFDAPGTATGTSDRYIFRVTNSFTTALALREDGVVRAPGNVTSTSTTTGTVVVTGGVGISENLYAGGYMSVGTKVRTAGSAPAPSACGTSPTISGSDLAGLVTTGTGTPTSCTITFNAAYAAEPYCVVRGKVQSQVTDYTVSSSAIVVTTTATDNVAIIYHCIARSAGWLLNRDLDPAANDNSPAFMEKAA